MIALTEISGAKDSPGGTPLSFTLSSEAVRLWLTSGSWSLLIYLILLIKLVASLSSQAPFRVIVAVLFAPYATEYPIDDTAVGSWS